MTSARPSLPGLPGPLLDRATLPYRPGGRFAWHFSRGKLGGDPAFAGMLRRGLIPPGSRVLDLGCGQGVLAALLLAVDGHGADWPAQWAPPPVGCVVRGIELMPRDVERARAALGRFGERARIDLGDICDTDFGRADVVTILDVLHYIDFAAQEKVLERVRDCLGGSGHLLLRVGDAAGGFPFRWSNWVDATVLAVRGHGFARLHCRPLQGWRELLERLGFAVETVPMHAGTLFANMMLVGRLDARCRSGTPPQPRSSPEFEGAAV